MSEAAPYITIFVCSVVFMVIIAYLHARSEDTRDDIRKHTDLQIEQAEKRFMAAAGLAEMSMNQTTRLENRITDLETQLHLGSGPQAVPGEQEIPDQYRHPARGQAGNG